MLEVYFFSQGSAKQVISQYQSLFGKPQLPPFWSLGWQESSFKGHNDEAIY
jgi:alpha-glucosidase (family GH31 glycosyl hydrolase)